LQSLCKHCHDSVKQTEERRQRPDIGCDEHGRPRDPGHDWNTESLSPPLATDAGYVAHGRERAAPAGTQDGFIGRCSRRHDLKSLGADAVDRTRRPPKILIRPGT
jgi:hypothetical protein